MNQVGGAVTLERQLVRVRWLGVVFAVLGIATQPYWPNSPTRLAAGAAVVLLILGNMTISALVARSADGGEESRLSPYTFAFDVAIVMAIVWVFAFERLSLTWALLFLLPMEGALRYRAKGAFLGAALVAVFFIPHSFYVADLMDSAFRIDSYVFVVGLSALIAGMTGAMAEGWHKRNLEFEEQSRRLTEINDLKDRFLAVTSHEIRGPLSALIAGIETLHQRSEKMSGRQRDEFFNMLLAQGLHVSRMLDDLLVTSQLQASTLHLHEEWSDLDNLVQQALDAAATKRRGHRLEVFVEPLECEVDHTRVGQIVRNLVENAYKYTPEQTRVKVSAKPVEEGLEITVSDQGPGIPPEKRDQLFDAFSRITETSVGQEGVGLGLYVVSQLVGAMGGEIDLSSSSRGTTFSVRIPCRRRERGSHLGLVRDAAQR